MKNRKNIQDELGNLGSKLPEAENPYAVPDGYFENFAAGMLARVKGVEEALSAAEETAALSPLLAGIPRNNPYTVPEGYFEETLSGLPAITGTASPALLSLIEKEGPYTVPLGYFANFHESVLQKRGARVVQMKKRGWMRMAVAAAITGIMALGGYMYTQRSDAGKPVAVQLKNVSTQELDAFIRAAGAGVSSTETAQSSPAVQPEVEKMLDDVSDRELDAFLSQVPYEEDLMSYN